MCFSSSYPPCCQCLPSGPVPLIRHLGSTDEVSYSAGKVWKSSPGTYWGSRNLLCNSALTIGHFSYKLDSCFTQTDPGYLWRVDICGDFLIFPPMMLFLFLTSKLGWFMFSESLVVRPAFLEDISEEAEVISSPFGGISVFFFTRATKKP